jgi:hypothetical protein
LSFPAWVVVIIAGTTAIDATAIDAVVVAVAVAVVADKLGARAVAVRQLSS